MFLLPSLSLLQPFYKLSGGRLNILSDTAFFLLAETFIAAVISCRVLLQFAKIYKVRDEFNFQVFIDIVNFEKVLKNLNLIRLFGRVNDFVSQKCNNIGIGSDA